MQELKVGIIPPPQPRILQRRLSAIFPRTSCSIISDSYRQQLKDLAISSTERFRTGYEGVLLTTRKELTTDTAITLPNETYSSFADGTVAIASGNDRKVADLIRVVSQHAQVINIREAEEEHTLSSKHDALSKAKSAAEILAQSEETTRRDVKNRPHLTIATDVVNKRLVEVTDDVSGLTHLAYQALGKPNNLRDIHGQELSKQDQEQSVRAMFADFAKMAISKDWHSIPYTIEMSTVIYNPKDPENFAWSTQKSSVFLSREGLSYLATEEGFKAYKTAVQDAGFDITRTAGGFELDVLDQMGFVTYITGTPEDIAHKQFAPQRDNAKNHAYAIAVGNVDAQLVASYFRKVNQSEETKQIKNIVV